MEGEIKILKIENNNNINVNHNDYNDNINNQTQKEDNYISKVKNIHINSNENLNNSNNKNINNSENSELNLNKGLNNILAIKNNKSNENANINTNNTNSNQDKSKVEKKLSCKEKYPKCYFNIKLLYFYNCYDDSEENKKRKENAPIRELFIVSVLLYYLFFCISELFLFLFIFLKHFCICLIKCLEEGYRICKESGKKFETEYAKQQKEKFEMNLQQLNQVNNRIEDLDKEHDKMDRRIVYGNPLNDPGYQERKIALKDKNYSKSREDLEWKREQIILDMHN